MINDFSSIRIFLQVADDGSFSETARRLNMSVSSIARKVSSLEDRLGLRLLNRTTRHQHLTEVGQIYYNKMKPLLSEFESVDEFVTSLHGGKKGTLILHIRSSVSRIITPHLGEFFERYPDITLDIKLTESRIDLVTEGVDLAIWLGHLEDSNYIARQLTTTDRIVVGSKAYLAKSPPVNSPEDLKHHNCIIFSGAQYSRDTWRFAKNGEIENIQVSGKLRTRSGWALRDYVMNDLGLAMVQKWMIEGDLKSDSIVQLFPEYDCNSDEMDVPLYIVYPHRELLPSKTRAFIDFLVEVFQDHARTNS